MRQSSFFWGGVRRACVLLVFFWLADLWAGEGVLEARCALGTNALVDAELTGTVRQVSKDGHMWALEDSSGGVLIRMEAAVPQVAPGNKVRIRGIGLPTPDYVWFQTGLLVDLDGIHGSGAKSNTISLKPGRLAIQVPYFNHAGDRALKLEYSGPGIPRQPIPDSAFFHRETNSATGEVAWAPGLRYKCCEGEWQYVPDFSSLTPVKKGVVSNLDLTVSSRADDVGLLFSGFLQIEQAGDYTFYLDSDDGSELFLGTDAPAIENLGTAEPLRPAKRIALGEVLSDHAPWLTIEGAVTWAGQSGDRLTLDLVTATGQMLVILENAPRGLSGIAPRSRIQATGFCGDMEDETGAQVAGRLWVLNADDVQIKSFPAENWRQISVSPIGFAVNNPITNSLLHLEGSIIFSPSHEIKIKDSSGEIQARGLPANALNHSQVEVLGYLQREGTNSLIRCMASHLWNFGEDEELLMPVLTSVEEVRNLPQEEAARAYPVRIQGVRTHEDGPMGMIQDVTSGIFVWDMPGGTHLGDYLEIDGVSDPGGFAPGIRAKKVRYLGSGPLPDPARVTWEELMSGSLDSQWVEIKGLVQPGSNTNREMIVAMKDGDARVVFTEMSPEVRSQLNGAVVRVRGVVFCEYDELTRRFKSSFLRARDLSQVTVESHLASELSSMRAKTVSEVRVFDPRTSPFKPLKVTGTVAGLRGLSGALLEGTNSLRFILRERTPLTFGDEVELIGFPGLTGKTTVLRNASARKLKAGKLPDPVSINALQMESGEFDAHIVQLEGRLMNYSMKEGGDMMDIEVGNHMVSVLLPPAPQGGMDFSVGSQLRLAGVLYCQTRSHGFQGDSFELVLKSITDVQVLETPSWWTFMHTVLVMTALLVVLVISLGWIRALRHSVVERTQQLRDEIELHKRTESELEEKTQLLEDEIDERKTLEVEKERIHKELMSASRQAGMAEVATGVLHNVGNVLNSVNISASVVTEKVRLSKTSGVTKVAGLISEHKEDLAVFLTEDEKGRKIPAYLTTLSESIAQERQEIQKELALMRDNVDHIKEIVATQQDFARMTDISEVISVKEIIADAFKMHSSSFLKYGVKFEFLVDDTLTITTDKHRVMQILVNLLQNARQACGDGEGEKKVIVRVSRSGVDRIKIEVIDNGVGIAPDNLNRIFVHGFTTKKDGHGFGLHSGALSAKALGGSLSVFSEGIGKGAIFTLELPTIFKE